MADRILVDTSVWVEVLRDPQSTFADKLADLLAGPIRVCTTGLVQQEVLQGLSIPSQVARVTSMLNALPYLPVNRETHRRAAGLYRKLRLAGVTVPTVDVALAQVALDHGARMWSLDGHFFSIASASRLKLLRS